MESRMKKPKPNVSPAELEILHYISEHHPITVREVAEYFAEAHGRARTTVLTLMERLRKKGYLTRSEAEGVNQYSPSVSRAELMSHLVSDFVEKALRGSLSPFMAYLGTEAELSDDELAELKRLVEQLDQQRSGKGREEGKA
jgi:predicted transcriptional regulator